MGAVVITRLSSDVVDEFMRLHDASGCGCYCTAWWVPTWEEWGARTAEENRALRIELVERGDVDGYLLSVDGRTAGWCQVGRRDRLPKLVAQYGLEPDERVWAITCLLLLPEYRHLGYARLFVGRVIEDLARLGVRRVQAFPRCGEKLPEEEVWTGPAALFAGLEFDVVRNGGEWPVLERRIDDELR